MTACTNNAAQGRPPLLLLRRTIAVALLLLAAAAPAQVLEERWLDVGELGGFHVVIPPGASEELQYAARTFQEYWKRCTGNEIGISTENGGTINVWLGRELATRSLVPESEMEDLGQEGFLIRTFTPTNRDAALGARKQFILAGATDLGTIYAVCEFFTRFLHVRWLAPGVVVAPRSTFHFPVVDIRAEHSFPQRVLSYAPFEGDQKAMTAFFHAHKLPLRAGVAPFAPAFDRVTAAQRLHDAGQFAQHPECFALLSDQTTRSETQICPTAPETRAQLVQCLLAGLRATPAQDTWSLSPGDAPPCACAACTSASTAQGGPMGPWLDLLNGIAGDLEQAMPKQAFHLHVLAAGPYRTVPAAPRPDPRVIVELATAGTNLARPLRDRNDPTNAAFAKDLRDWSRVTHQLHLWHSVVDPDNPLLPLPNINHLREDLQLFAQVDLEGVEIQVGSPASPHYQADAQLRANLAARYLWEPDLPLQTERPELLRALYGGAAPQMERYLDASIAAAESASPLVLSQVATWWRHAAPGLAEGWDAAFSLPLPPAQQTTLLQSALPVLALTTACSDSPAFEAQIAKAGLKRETAPLQSYAAALCNDGAPAAP